MYSHLALVVRHHGAAMLLDDGSQSRRVEVSVGHPAWKLVVPDTVVTFALWVSCLVRLLFEN